MCERPRLFKFCSCLHFGKCGRPLSVQYYPCARLPNETLHEMKSAMKRRQVAFIFAHQFVTAIYLSNALNPDVLYIECTLPT